MKAVGTANGMRLVGALEVTEVAVVVVAVVAAAVAAATGETGSNHGIECNQ